MKKLFIHNAFFRLIAPLGVGALIYLLILLINNNIEQLRETFFGEELYLCIGLAYLVQEWNRLSVYIFNSATFTSALIEMICRMTISLLITGTIVGSIVYLYFAERIGYSPNQEEITIFLIVYGAISILYLILYFGHNLLYKINSDLVKEEEALKQDLNQEFTTYIREVNPQLLYDGLESIIVAIRRNDLDKVDATVDSLSFLYRHLLARRDQELIKFQEELHAIENLHNLVNLISSGSSLLETFHHGETTVIPSSIVSIIETLIRTSILSEDQITELRLTENSESLEINMTYIKRLQSSEEDILEYWKNRYKTFTDQEWEINNSDSQLYLKIPTIQLSEFLSSSNLS